MQAQTKEQAYLLSLLARLEKLDTNVSPLAYYQVNNFYDKSYDVSFYRKSKVIKTEFVDFIDHPNIEKPRLLIECAKDIQKDILEYIKQNNVKSYEIKNSFHPLKSTIMVGHFEYTIPINGLTFDYSLIYHPCDSHFIETISLNLKIFI